MRLSTQSIGPPIVESNTMRRTLFAVLCFISTALTPPEAVATSLSSQRNSDDSAEDQPLPMDTPAAHNQNGITDTGRAVNDPRVSARPVTNVEVHTAHLTLFPEHAAPAVNVISRDIPRASNDPRGPRGSSDSLSAAGQDGIDDIPDAANQ